MLHKIYLTVVQMHSRSATNKFLDSAIAKHVSLGSKKMSYMVACGLGPYFQQATVKEIIQGNSYFTLHFDETVSAQMKKHVDLLVGY